MAEQKILISIQVQDKAAKKTIEATSSSLNKLATSQNKVSKATNQTRATSGLNNAILMETSRLASDASFGFTAMANNLSQLINLFKASKDATGSYLSSIKSLISIQSALLIGVQLLITYGSDLYNFFKELANGSQLLQETFKNAGKEVQNTAGSFETYIRTLQDSSKSQEEQKDAINALNKEFPDYIKQLKDANVSLSDVANKTEEAVKQNNLYRDSIVKLAMARAAQNKIEELASEKIDLIIEQDLERLEDAEKIKTQTVKNESRERAIARLEEERDSGELTDAQIGNVNALIKREKQRLESGRERLADLKEVNREEIKEIDEQINALVKFTDIQIKESIRGSGARNRIFKAADLDFEKETQQSRERLIKGFIKDEKLQIKIKFDGIRERAILKQKEFEDDQQRRLNEFLAVEKDENKRLDAQKRVNDEIAKSKESLNKYIKQLNEEQLVTINNLTIEQAEKIIDADRELQYKLQENRQRAADQEILNEGIKAGNLFNLKNEQLEKERERLQLALENENLTFQERMNLQKQLTDVEQQQTDARIKIAELEALSKRELLDQTANGLMAFSNLAGKETGEGKGLAVASTLISTYSAAQKAYESQFLPIPTVNSPLRGALAAATAVASGLGNVKEILKVKTPNDKSQGGKTTIQAPDFNVVGASQTSQLAQTVATQQAKPVKAFVVGKDISTQQELDRNITNTASFG
jgi:hypothetical protein